MKFLQVLVLIFGLSVFANAQKAILSGTVYDLENSVIPNVKVTIINKKNGEVVKVDSNLNGIYTVELNQGEYNIKFYTEGFRFSEIESYKTGLRGKLNLDITLDIQEITEHPPIISSEVRKEKNKKYIKRKNNK